MTAITVYTRQGCHLCAVAEAIARDVAAGRATVATVDIDADPDLRERYTVRVPVVAVDGVEIAQYELDPAQLRAALDRADAASARAPIREPGHGLPSVSSR